MAETRRRASQEVGVTYRLEMEVPGLIGLDQTGTRETWKGGSGVKDGRGGGDPSAQARLCERGRWGGAARTPKGILDAAGGAPPGFWIGFE